jgi:Tfp pilus assembly protein PilN
LFFSKLALGVDWSADGLRLVALGRRFRKLLVLDWVHVPDPWLAGEGKSLPAQAGRVQEFLKRNHVREARVIACLPREAFLVKFLDLPAEAESQLAKVIGYQIDSLHPFQSVSIRWDCAVVARDTKTKQVRVMIAIAEQSALDRQYHVLNELGLRADSLTLAAAPLAALLKTSLPETALVVLGRGKRIELLGFHQGSLLATRELACDAEGKRNFERELHALWSVLPAAAPAPYQPRSSPPAPSAELDSTGLVGDQPSKAASSSRAGGTDGLATGPATIPTFTCGQIPEAFSDFLRESKPLPPPKLPLVAPEKFDLENMLSALAAAHSGLRRKSSPAVNLLPLEYRTRPSRWGPVPLYALAASASLMALMLLGHGFIETALYGSALNRQIGRLSSQAEGARRESQQAARLSEQATLLESLRAETWQKLQILREITNLLPDGTWVQDLQVGQGTVEFSGLSNRAAELIQPLENSPYFSQVEFASPITRGGENKEAFRIRMRVGKPAVTGTRP